MLRFLFYLCAALQGPKSLTKTTLLIAVHFMAMTSPLRAEAPSWWPEGCHSAGLWQKLHNQSPNPVLEWGEWIQQDPHMSCSRKKLFVGPVTMLQEKDALDIVVVSTL